MSHREIEFEAIFFTVIEVKLECLHQPSLARYESESSTVVCSTAIVINIRLFFSDVTFDHIHSVRLGVTAPHREGRHHAHHFQSRLSSLEPNM